jgi:hypothetical protein
MWIFKQEVIMFELKRIRKICCPEILYGLSVIAAAAGSVYGTDSKILSASKDSVICTNKMKILIEQGTFEECNAELVRKHISNLELPADGLKTSIIIAEKMLSTAYEAGMDHRAFLRDVKAIAERCIYEFELMNVSSENGLPGSGLYLMNVTRSLMRYFEETNGGATGHSELLIEAMHEPCILIARNAGRDPYEAYARIKGASPTQFYSLHHFGLERSVPLTKDRDLWKYGFDVSDGNIIDVYSRGITVPLDTATDVINTVVLLCEAICSVKGLL